MKLSVEGELLEDVIVYRRIVGSLIYMTITRPDLSYAVGLVSQFMHMPSKPHLDVAGHILRYVKSTLQYEIFMRQDVRYRYMGIQMLIGLVVSSIGDLLVALCFPLEVVQLVGATRSSQ